MKLSNLSTNTARVRRLAHIPVLLFCLAAIEQNPDGPRSGPRSPARLKQPDPEQDSRGIFVYEKLLSRSRQRYVHTFWLSARYASVGYEHTLRCRKRRDHASAAALSMTKP